MSSKKFVILAFIIFGCSCSVKEDRSLCPCVVSLEIATLPSLVSVHNPAGELVIREVVRSSPAEFTLSRGDYAFTLGAVSKVSYDGTGDAREAIAWGADAEPEVVFDADGAVEIPLWEDCPGVWMCAMDLDARGESVSAAPVLHRLYALLSVTIVHPEGETVPYGIDIDGSVSGYSFAAEPIPGEFSFVPSASGTDTPQYQISLPRQKDNSLLLHITRFGSPSEILRTFAIGEILFSEGYDWGAPDLMDISVEINYRFSYLNITTDLWSRTIPLEIVI